MKQPKMTGPAEILSSLVIKGSFVPWQAVTLHACSISLKAEDVWS